MEKTAQHDMAAVARTMSETVNISREQFEELVQRNMQGLLAGKYLKIKLDTDEQTKAAIMSARRRYRMLQWFCKYGDKETYERQAKDFRGHLLRSVSPFSIAARTGHHGAPQN